MLEMQLERQQSKGSDFIALNEEECKELIGLMYDASSEINFSINGSI